MQENFCADNRKSTALKSRLSIALTVILAIVSAVLVLFSALACCAAYNKKAENTIELFGYKIFYCENDIEGTDIKGGSLVIVKNSDNDEFYKADFLSENAVLVVENLGSVIKNSGFYIVLCIMIPFAFIFIIVLLSELKKLHYRHATQPYSALEFEEISEEEFIIED